MKFKTQYSHSTVYQHPGNDIKHEYASYINDIGETHLHVTGEYSFSDYINSSLDLCDFVNLSKMADLGSVFNYMPTSIEDLDNYGIFDITDMPNSKGELFTLLHNSQNLFNGLPSEIKQHFNNNSKYFFSQIGKGDFNDYFASLRRMEQNAIKESEAQENEHSNA